MNCFVYGLCDPTTGELRYLGKTTRGEKRPLEHLSPHSYNKNRHASHWVKSLVERGLTPDWFVLEECGSPAELNEAEMHHIALYKSLGARLTNGTLGGDGLVPTAQTRERLRVSHTGKKQSSDTIAKRSRTMTGRTRPAWVVAKIAAKRRGKKHTDEAKRRIGAAALGRKHTLKTKEAIRLTSTGRQHSSESVIRGAKKISTPVVDLTTGIQYYSIQEAGRTLGLSPGNICEHIRGVRCVKHVGGHRFSYVKTHSPGT